MIVVFPSFCDHTEIQSTLFPLEACDITDRYNLRSISDDDFTYFIYNVGYLVTTETMKLVIFVVLSLAALASTESSYESYQNTYQSDYQNNYQNYYDQPTASNGYQSGVATAQRRQSLFE